MVLILSHAIFDGRKTECLTLCATCTVAGPRNECLSRQFLISCLFTIDCIALVYACRDYDEQVGKAPKESEKGRLMCFSKDVLGTALRDIMNENVPKYTPPSPPQSLRKRSRKGSETIDPSQVRRVIVLDFDGPVWNVKLFLVFS